LRLSAAQLVLPLELPPLLETNPEMLPAYEATETDAIYARMLYAWAKRMRVFSWLSKEGNGITAFQLQEYLNSWGSTEDTLTEFFSTRRLLGKFLGQSTNLRSALLETCRNARGERIFEEARLKEILLDAIAAGSRSSHKDCATLYGAWACVSPRMSKSSVAGQGLRSRM
jgi:hypothetical protein